MVYRDRLDAGNKLNPDNWVVIEVKYKENVRMGSSVSDRWMIYGKEATPNATFSLQSHYTKKSSALDYAKDLAKGLKPAMLKIYNKDGSLGRKHEYEA